MTEIQTFTGFPRAGLRFIEDLAANNNRDWFQTHKTDYTANLLEPAQTLVIALGERLKDIAPDIIYDTRTNGAGSLMRIYRDTRFSKDKTPYKRHVDMMFWEGIGRKIDCPAFGLRISPVEGNGLMTGMHGFPKSMLAAYRDAVVDDDLGPELVQAIDSVKSAGDYDIGGEHYKRVPRGFDSEHERANLLRYAALFAYSPQIEESVVTSPDLVEVCFEHFRHMAPIHHWLVKVHRRR